MRNEAHDLKKYDGRIASLIDIDNSTVKKIDPVFSGWVKFGVATARRAYGSWKNPSFKGWDDVKQKTHIDGPQHANVFL